MGPTPAVVSGICLLCILLFFVFLSGCGKREKGVKQGIAACPPDPILPRRYSPNPTLVEERLPPPAYTREPVIYPNAFGQVDPVYK